ncbi:MAG: diguanylate cyclase [Dethiobacter sp.]|nr:diguanylate cyclase [Dethiobacter sp.]MBS3901511.1 diguanylate cyclase [Dethiobacter sp.]MBS3989039.1 diguanylate cyclase [Dethiobacter sp.]
MESFIHKSPMPGIDRWFRTNIIYRTDCFNQKKYILVTRDITEKVEAERAVYTEKERLRVTLQSIGDAVIATDKSGSIISLNPIAEQLTGWSEQEAKGKNAQEVFHIISEKTREVCEDPVQKVLDSGNIIGLANHTALISKDGTERPIADSAAPIKDEAGVIHGAVLVFRDVTGEKLRHEEIEYLSYHDSLTGLYNRRFFEEELNRMDVERNLPITLIIGDVNGLKLINDAFGHLVGDRLLQKAAVAIKQACRVDDIVARWGGDEFVIILPKTNQKSAVELMQRIRNSCTEAEIEAIKLSISLGYETKEKADEYISDVLKSAERNMYKNKLQESQSMVGSAIKVIHSTLFEKNQREAEHSRRVAKISKNIAKAMGLPEAKVNEMETIGLMHDIGKIAIAETILEKTGELTEEEWTEIHRHPEVGYRILSTSNDTVEIARYVLAHHEHFDGSGYPSHIKGEDIPLQARILAVADAFDALTSKRVHRAAYSLPYAIKVLQNNAGKQFDPEVVKIFIEKVLTDSDGMESK